jgi:hypothetical protein
MSVFSDNVVIIIMNFTEVGVSVVMNLKMVFVSPLSLGCCRSCLPIGQ